MCNVHTMTDITIILTVFNERGGGRGGGGGIFVATP